MEAKILTEIGLTQKESEVYLALVELGSSSASNIIQKTGFHRAVVYDLLERLIEKGLVGHVVKGKEGIKNVLEDILRAKPKEWLVLGSGGETYKLLPAFLDDFHKRRIKSK